MLNILRAKCLIIGESGVGKSAFLNTFLEDGSQFLKNYHMTLGIDLHEKLIRIPETDKAVQLFFFDCSGKDFYRKLILNMCEHTSMIFLVYDVTSEESFQELENIYEQVSANTGISDPLKGIILGNKVDLTTRRRVSPKAAHELASKLGLTYFEGSAKEQKGVEAPFFFLANEWFKIYSENEESTKMMIH